MGLAQRLIFCGAVLALVCGSSGEIGKRCKKAKACCSFSQGKSKIIECDLSSRKNVVDIPKDKTSSKYAIMRFSHGSHVTVAHNALDRLEATLLTDLGDLTFKGSNESRTGSNDGTPPVPGSSMTIDGVRNLVLRRNSLDGWQSKGSIFWIKNIENCRIDKSAFAPSTTIKRLLLENITSLVLAEGAFRATVDELLLRNVTIANCPQGAFGGRVDRLLMSSVTVESVKTECVSPQHAWQALTLRQSRLGRVSRSGITGAIADVTVTECNITTVDSGGIQVNVSSFSLNETNIDELKPDALQVQADQTISLQGFRVSGLHKNAFRGLRVVGTPNRGINVTALSVTRADDGSLMFADGADVRVRELTFDIHKNCSMGYSPYEGAYTHSVYVESAWQPAVEIGSVSSRLHTVFQPLFACDFYDVLDTLESRAHENVTAPRDEGRVQ